ncbi:hypothetical protein CGLO_16200 [Colletotrichum gloeosporioides Cg-14]|uniref:DUF3669 domain-containing protein n=1 Tax=Colletotrichum gloeosporioides (strain Cg-14) TaxID=1237896 RepID=T0JP93_COLGC|nr:hypothetical protein CGLO_16200 [Colletotrichum gloeosporioides Cg-14]
MASVQLNMITQFTSNHSAGPLRHIGEGACGSVWCASSKSFPYSANTPLVLKREDMSDVRSITHEAEIHHHILQALANPRVATTITTFRVNIPLSQGLLHHTNSAAWSQILPRLPAGYTACSALVSEKVHPFPFRVRKLLLEQLTACEDPQKVAQGHMNTHCLIRAYLGKRKYSRVEEDARPAHLKKLRPYSLRNFPLCVDQMEDLELDVEGYALAMAAALAFMHWTAKVDANDVEFVLGQRRSDKTRQTLPCVGEKDFESAALGPHALWVLDFDCCREMTMDEEGVKTACKSFWRNDQYYPRPGSNNPFDQRLWAVFREQFLKTSDGLLESDNEEVKKLPVMLMDMIEETKGKSLRGALVSDDHIEGQK